MAGSSRFDCYPSDFLNGVIGMRAEEIAAYTVVLMLQYDRGEPVLYEGRERELAIRCGLTQGRLAKAIENLVSLDKLELVSGKLQNRRALREIEKIRERIEKNRENSAKGGESTRAKFEGKDKENNDAIGPTGQPTGQPKIGPIPSSPVPRPPSVGDNLIDFRKPTLLSEPDKPSRTRNAYPSDFEEFWKGFPTDANMSKSEAFKEWKRLPADDKALATKSLPAFRAFCSSHGDYRPVHANRYLSQRRFEGHAKTAERSAASSAQVRQDTPQGRAWDEFYRDTKGKGVPWVNGRWSFPSEWPPSHPAEHGVAAQ